ncbi:hypothetical protein [Methylobacterium sp. WL8]|uniref:hypothetical protein n=1 Tax=Methylobacterium sp. WL8 TaxID=2603899 RepID=UPI0011CAAB79|nr:hypothetical protein [Methylobacterium sp. WL8]TXN76691.1 hypothetical protein FV234_24490 [Methylobacterium sp. WL8]
MTSQPFPTGIDQHRLLNAAERAVFNSGVQAVIDAARDAAAAIEAGENAATDHMLGAAEALRSFAEAAEDLRLERPDLPVAAGERMQ